MKKHVALSMALLLCGGTALAEPFGFGVSNTLDLLSNVQGGIKTGTRVLEKFDASASFAGDEAGWDGWNALVHGQWTPDNSFSGTHVGDAQGVSNIEAPEGFRIMEAWVSRDLSDNGGAKLGIVDLNSEFDVQNVGLLFLNSSSGIAPDFSQSGVNGPSIFPTTGLGAVAWWNPNEAWSIKAGLFEGIAGNPAHPGRTDITLGAGEGVLLVLESRYQFTSAISAGLGGWHYTEGFPAIGAPGVVHGNSGIYGIAEATLFAAPDDGPRLDAWLRAGLANGRINSFNSYIGGGLVYSGPFGREGDQAGLSISHARFGAPARIAGGLKAAETTIEATYAFALNEWAVIQPDLQYVINPGGDPALDNALVVGTRLLLFWE